MRSSCDTQPHATRCPEPPPQPPPDPVSPPRRRGGRPRIAAAAATGQHRLARRVSAPVSHRRCNLQNEEHANALSSLLELRCRVCRTVTGAFADLRPSHPAGPLPPRRCDCAATASASVASYPYAPQRDRPPFLRRRTRRVPLRPATSQRCNGIAPRRRRVRCGRCGGHGHRRGCGLAGAALLRRRCRVCQSGTLVFAGHAKPPGDLRARNGL